MANHGNGAEKKNQNSPLWDINIVISRILGDLGLRARDHEESAGILQRASDFTTASHEGQSLAGISEKR